MAGIAFVQALTHTTVANTLFTPSAIPFITAALARVLCQRTFGMNPSGPAARGAESGYYLAFRPGID